MSAPRAWAELSAHGPTCWRPVAAHGCMEVIDQPAVGLLTRFDLLVPTIDPVTLP